VDARDQRGHDDTIESHPAISDLAIRQYTDDYAQCTDYMARWSTGRQSMIPKSGYRFSEKIMLKQKAKAKRRFSLKSFRFSAPWVRRRTR
jgi:hypothetical protein